MEGRGERAVPRASLDVLSLTRPAALVGIGVVLAVAAFHLWITPANPPGFLHDEASSSYSSYRIAESLRDQDGALLPLYIPSFGDYKGPVFLYSLAAAFRVTGPHSSVARGVAAVSVLAAVLLLGLLARRRTGSAAVAVAIVVLAGLTPWLFELGRVAYEVSMEPLAIVLLLLAVERAWRLRSWGFLSTVPVGLALGLLVYAYTAGRVLGPLYAAALVVFAGRGRWRWVLASWGTFALTLLPLFVYWRRHPGALSARYEATTFVHDDLSLPAIVGKALWNAVRDVNLWHWTVSGDPKPYIHTWGTGSIFASVVLLAAVGAVAVLRSRPRDLWWRYVLILLVLSPIPAALTDDRYYALRLVPLPVLLTVLAIPGVALLLEAARRGPAGKVALAVLGALVAVQFGHFVDVYRWRGQTRTVVFEAGVPQLLGQAFAGGRTVYVDFDDRHAQTFALWYAAEHGIARGRVSILPDGGMPPLGSRVFGAGQECDFACSRIAESAPYWVARTDGSKS